MLDCCEELSDSNGQPGLVLMISGNCCLQISDHGNLYETTRGGRAGCHVVQLLGSDWSPQSPHEGVEVEVEVYNMRLFSCKISSGSQSDYSGTHCGAAGALVGTSVQRTEKTSDNAYKGAHDGLRGSKW